MTDWLSTTQVAALQGVTRSPRTIAEHCRRGLVPALRDPITGQWRLKHEDAVRVYAPQLSVAEAVRLIDAGR